jgi:hypothetical protein
MYESGKYARVKIGSGAEAIYVRIKKDSPMPEADKAKLTAWAEANGFSVSNLKRILHAE